MRYAQILPFDTCNGEGIGISLFVQGCSFHCKGCFNSETWDFNGGKEWTKEVEEQFLELAEKPYIKRISILGGEPLAKENINDVLNLIKRIKNNYSNKKIWLYTGHTLKNILSSKHYDLEKLLTSNELYDEFTEKKKRKAIIKLCDVIIDGRFEEDKKDLTLKFRGSSNQRIIDVKQSIEQNEVILLTE